MRLDFLPAASAVLGAAYGFQSVPSLSVSGVKERCLQHAQDVEEYKVASFFRSCLVAYPSFNAVAHAIKWGGIACMAGGILSYAPRIYTILTSQELQPKDKVKEVAEDVTVTAMCALMICAFSQLPDLL